MVLSLPFSWFTGARVRKVFWFTFGLFLAASLALGIFRFDNDFLWHRENAQQFWEGGQSNHYLPGRWVINSLTAWMPYRVDRAVFLAVALAALAGTLMFWHRILQAEIPLRRNQQETVAAWTLFLTIAFLHRDLMDCGLQTLLLFFLSAGAYCLFRARPWQAGFWLATAAVYKVTPLLFFPYLVYKRQWKSAGTMVLFFGLWCLAPSLLVGWERNLAAHQQWFAFFREITSNPDPSENGVEPPNHRSQSLPLTFARFLQTHPPGHRLHVEHPLFAQFLDLPTATAKRMVQGGMLFLAGLLAWRFRKPFTVPPAGVGFAQEWAVVTVLCAILSPLCWIQHLVLVLPLLYVGVRNWCVKDRLSPAAGILAMLVGACFVLVHKDFFGTSLYLVVLSYKPHVFAVLLLMVMVLRIREAKPETAGQASGEGTPSRLAA